MRDTSARAQAVHFDTSVGPGKKHLFKPREAGSLSVYDGGKGFGKETTTYRHTAVKHNPSKPPTYPKLTQT